MILDLAKLQLEGQFSTGDSLDAKALGILTLDIAAIGVLLAVKDSLGTLWGLPLVLLALSAVPAIFMLVARSFDAGPEFESFYNAQADGPERAAVVAMLSELRATLMHDDRVLSQKAVAAGLALACMTLGLATGTVEFIAKPEVHILCQTKSRAAVGASPTPGSSSRPLSAKPTPSPASPSSNGPQCLIGS